MSPTHGSSRLSLLAPLVAALLFAGLAADADAQTVIATAPAKTMMGHNPCAQCLNFIAWPEPVPCLCANGPSTGFTTLGDVHNLDSHGIFRDLQSATLSFVTFTSFAYHHRALDYWPGSPAGGCSSCGGSQGLGGSELPKLFVERIHRYRDMTQQPSSFGAGVFCNYDVALLFEPANMPGMYAPYTVEPSAFWTIELTMPAAGR